MHMHQINIFWCPLYRLCTVWRAHGIHIIIVLLWRNNTLLNTEILVSHHTVCRLYTYYHRSEGWTVRTTLYSCFNSSLSFCFIEKSCEPWDAIPLCIRHSVNMPRAGRRRSSRRSGLFFHHSQTSSSPDHPAQTKYPACQWLTSTLAQYPASRAPTGQRGASAQKLMKKN